MLNMTSASKALAP